MCFSDTNLQVTGPATSNHTATGSEFAHVAKGVLLGTYASCVMGVLYLLLYSSGMLAFSLVAPKPCSTFLPSNVIWGLPLCDQLSTFHEHVIFIIGISDQPWWLGRSQLVKSFFCMC